MRLVTSLPLSTSLVKSLFYGNFLVAFFLSPEAITFPFRVRTTCRRQQQKFASAELHIQYAELSVVILYAPVTFQTRGINTVTVRICTP